MLDRTRIRLKHDDLLDKLAKQKTFNKKATIPCTLKKTKSLINPANRVRAFSTLNQAYRVP